MGGADLTLRRMMMVKEGPDLSDYQLVNNVYCTLSTNTSNWYTWNGFIPTPFAINANNIRIETSVLSNNNESYLYLGTGVDTYGMSNDPRLYITDLIFSSQYSGNSSRYLQMSYNDTYYYRCYATKKITSYSFVDYFDTSITTNYHSNLIPDWGSSVTWQSNTNETTYNTGLQIIDGKTVWPRVQIQKGSDSANFFSPRIRYCKIYNGGSLVCDLRAAKKISTNKFGLVDLVTGYFLDRLVHTPTSQSYDTMYFQGQV